MHGCTRLTACPYRCQDRAEAVRSAATLAAERRARRDRLAANATATAMAAAALEVDDLDEFVRLAFQGASLDAITAAVRVLRLCAAEALLLTIVPARGAQGETALFRAAVRGCRVLDPLTGRSELAVRVLLDLGQRKGADVDKVIRYARSCAAGRSARPSASRCRVSAASTLR